MKSPREGVEKRREKNIKEKRWVELGSCKMTEAGIAKERGGDQEAFDRQQSGPAQNPPPGPPSLDSQVWDALPLTG